MVFPTKAVAQHEADLSCNENCGITLGVHGMFHTGTCVSLKDTILALRKTVNEKDAIIAQSKLVIDALKVEVYDATHVDDDPWS